MILVTDWNNTVKMKKEQNSPNISSPQNNTILNIVAKSFSSLSTSDKKESMKNWKNRSNIISSKSLNVVDRFCNFKRNNV